MASLWQGDARLELLQPVRVRMSLSFPDKRLLQWDCGKLQVLDVLLRRLQAEGHRCLIFTQMTKMLNVLEVTPSQATSSQVKSTCSRRR